MRSTWIESLETRQLLAAYAPDVTFASDGIIPPTTSAADPSIKLLHADSNGLLVTTVANYSTLRVERFTLAGQLDTSYTPRDLPISNSYSDRAYADQVGRLLVLSYDYRHKFLTVTRYKTDGTLDTSFGHSGIAKAPTLPGVGRGEVGDVVYDYGLTTDSENTIYLDLNLHVTNTATQAERDQRYLFKLSAGGRVDSSYGAGGVVTGSSNTYWPYTSTNVDTDKFFFATDSQNRLIVGETQKQGVFTFTRYLPSGRVDKSYGKSGGVVTYNTLGSSFLAALDSQGRAMLLTVESSAKVVRFTANGRLDPNFGTNGVVSTRIYGEALLIQNDGKIVIQGSTGGRYLIRMNTDGSRDNSFGSGGLATEIQTDNIPDQISLDGLYTLTKLIAQLPDGSYLTAVSTREGDSFQKIAPLVAARRGTSGKLYLTGETGTDDTVTVTPSGSGAHVVFNGHTFNIPKSVRGVAANLGGGNNVFNSSLITATGVVTGNGNDVITTGDGDDTVRSGQGNDTITTHGGYDKINFDGGDKKIDAGIGTGYITGGGNADADEGDGPLGRIRITGVSTNDSRQGGWHVDVHGGSVSVSLGGTSASIAVDAAQSAIVDARAVTSSVSAKLSGRRVSYDTLTAATNLKSTASAAANLNGGSGDDSITAIGAGATITGGSGDDQIVGTDGDDYISAGDGDDKVDGRGGNDNIFGVTGNDTLIGGIGRDTLLGDEGNDLLIAGQPNIARRNTRNLLDGGPGRDRYQIESPYDVLENVETLVKTV